MSRPEPTSWDSPCAAAFGTSSPSMVADKSIETKSPSATGRSTPVRVPNRARKRLQFGVDVFVADLDRVHRNLQRAQVGKGDRGADVDLGGECQLLAVLLLGHLDVGLAKRLHFRLGDRLPIAGWAAPR